MSSPDPLVEEFPNVPLNRLLGLRLERLEEGEAEVAMPVKEAYLQEGGVVHGGVISALADTAAVYALIPGLPEDRTLTGVEFKVSFLKPVRLGAGDLVARARTVRRGRQIGFSEVEVSQDGKPVATGTFTFLIYRAP